MNQSTMKKFEKALSDLKMLVNDPENYIFEETAEAMRIVDIKRAEINIKVDDKYLKIISKLKDFRVMCNKNLGSETFLQLQRIHRNAFDALVFQFENLETLEIVPDSVVNLLNARAEKLKTSIKKVLLHGKNFELYEIEPVAITKVINK